MQIKKIIYSESRTIAISRFEPVRPTVSAEALISEGENPANAMRDLKEYVREQITEATAYIKAKK